MSRRPIPRGAQDIGTWYIFTETTLYIAVVTNALLFCLTTDIMRQQTPFFRTVVFIVFVSSVVLFKMAYSALLSDIPEDVQRIRRRHESLNASLIKGARLWDSDDDETIHAESFAAVIYDEDLSG